MSEKQNNSNIFYCVVNLANNFDAKTLIYFMKMVLDVLM